MEFSQLIHIGTYGLHTLHNAFSHGAKASSWKVRELLSAITKYLIRAHSDGLIMSPWHQQQIRIMHWSSVPIGGLRMN